MSFSSNIKEFLLSTLLPDRLLFILFSYEIVQDITEEGLAELLAGQISRPVTLSPKL